MMVFACEVKAIIVERQVGELRNIVSKDFHSEGLEVETGEGGGVCIPVVPDIDKSARDGGKESGIHMPVEDRVGAERGESTGEIDSGADEIWQRAVFIKGHAVKNRTVGPVSALKHITAHGTGFLFGKGNGEMGCIIKDGIDLCLLGCLKRQDLGNRGAVRKRKNRQGGGDESQDEVFSRRKKETAVRCLGEKKTAVRRGQGKDAIFERAELNRVKSAEEEEPAGAGGQELKRAELLRLKRKRGGCAIKIKHSPVTGNLLHGPAPGGCPVCNGADRADEQDGKEQNKGC